MTDFSSFAVTGTDNPNKQVSKNFWNSFLSAVAAGIDAAVATVARYASDRDALAATALTSVPVYLAEDGREGWFKFDSSDLTSAVTADTLQGIYIAKSSDVTGASGAWVRQGYTLTPHMFGGVESVKSGDRLTGVPAYAETMTDATAAIQALIDMVAFETGKAWLADLSGFWGIRDHDADGYCITIEQPYWLVRTFRMGHFAVTAVSETGTAAFKISEACYNHRTEGRWEIWGGPNQDSDGYSVRGFDYGVEARTISLWDIESIYIRGFRKWGVMMPNTPVDATYNQNIAAKFGRLKATNCGSVPDRSGYRLETTYSGGTRTGVANAVAQRSVITLDTAGYAEHFDTADEDWVVINGEPYQVMAVDTVNNELEIYPWLPTGEEVSGTLYGMFGGGVHVGGSDTARVKIELLDCLSCGIGVYSRGLYGMTVQECMVQTSGAAMVLGSEGGNTIGNAILGAHWEANLFDLISRNAQGSNAYICGLTMGADDGNDPFKLCRSIAANDGTALNTNAQAFPGVTFNIGGVDYHSASGGTKSRAFTPTLSNDPRYNRIEKVANSLSITLKYRESVDRFFKGHFTADLVVIGTSGGAPTGAISVALDATDAAAGITIDGGAGPYSIGAGTASGVVRLHFALDTNGSTKNWIVTDLTSGAASTNLTGESYQLDNAAATQRSQLFNSGTQWYHRTGIPGSVAVNGTLNIEGQGVSQPLATIRFRAQNYELLDDTGSYWLYSATDGHAYMNRHMNLSSGRVYKINSVQVVGPRATGWAAATGTATRTTFDTTTVTTAQLAERVKALIDDLTTHGLVGA